MFGIGEFSKITGLTIKTLRFYHEQGILQPTRVAGKNGYRYYSENKIETARIISQLRQFGFSIAEIKLLLAENEDEADIVEFLEQHKQKIAAKLRKYQQVNRSINQIIKKEKEARDTMKVANFEVESKTTDSILVAGIRMTGRYSDCGEGFAKIGKHFGRHICGKAFLLHYDSEYKDDDADFEACMPIRKGTPTDEISVRELPGGRCISLLHKGAYDDLGRSYAKIVSYANERDYRVELPTREIYVKGPGIIFKGNPSNYLTEIQLLFQEN